MKTALYLVLLISLAYSSAARLYKNPGINTGELFAGFTQQYLSPAESFASVAGTTGISENAVSVESQKPKRSVLTTNTEANILTIGLPEDARFVSIWNSNGKLMYEQKLSSDRLQIDMQTWKAGDYVMHCAHGVSTTSKTFTVRH